MASKIGLDIGESSIKAVEIAYDKNNKSILRNAYLMPTPMAAFQDGTIIDYPELSEQISKIIKSGGLQNYRIAIAIKGSNIIVKKAKIPFLSKQQLESELPFMADQYMKVDLEEYAVDFSLLDVDTLDSFAQVAFAAIRKDSLADYVSVFESAEIKPSIISVEAYALCDLYTYLKMPRDLVSLIAHIGHNSTLFVFVNKGVFSHQESAQGAGSYCTNLIVSLAEIPEDKAELVKSTPSAFPEGDAVKKIISEKFIPDFVTSVEQAINSYCTYGNPPPARILLSGGGATLFALESALKEKFEVTVAVMNPGSLIDVQSSTAKQIMDIKPAIFNVAIGMALR